MRYSRLPLSLMPLLLLALLCPSVSSAAPPPASYAVVVSQATRQQADWSRVVDALVDKHAAEVLVYDRNVAESAGPLRKLHPRYTCFVATPTEATPVPVGGLPFIGLTLLGLGATGLRELRRKRKASSELH